MAKVRGNNNETEIKTTKGHVSAVKSFMKKVFADKTFFNLTPEEQKELALKEVKEHTKGKQEETIIIHSKEIQ